MVVPKGGWKQKRDSFSVARVYFKDGNKRTFYSWDWKHKYSKVRDREFGLRQLRNRIVKRYATSTDVIEIYDLQTGKLIEKYFEGQQVEIN